MEVIFTINEKLYKVNAAAVPLDTTLNTFIRSNADLRGTKFMCLEGGCGACTVTVKGVHPVTKEKQTYAVNSCLTNIYSCHGLDIITIEGVGNKKAGYHVTQKRLADLNGTQCGYCSPGMVMNMFSLLESKNGAVTMEEVENSFGGNICRCTGYRPILDAFKSLAVDADEKLVAMCKDIEDLDKTCPKTGNRCAGFCNKITETKKGIHLVFDDQKEWHKVYNVQDIFAVIEKSGTKKLMLVSGNTAHGVFRRSPYIQFFVDITGVEELRSYSVGKTLDFGGNVSLTEMMEILEESSKLPNFEYCEELRKQVDMIGNLALRNVASIAGNLIIKYYRNDFPSDLFVPFETIGATITILESGGRTTLLNMLDFLKIDIKKKLIMKVSLPPLDPKKYVFRTYKIMPRAQNCHAYVNASFLLEFNEKKTIVLSARICYGGINSKFNHADATEKLLVGKNIYTNETLKSALNCLSEEIKPDWILPDASPEYRKYLALSLFYKFVLNTCPKEITKPLYQSGGYLLERPLSSGTQRIDTYKEKWPLTKPVPKYEGLTQCSGEVQYSNDVPYQIGELWGAFVLAKETHAIITDIDTTQALSLQGVEAFYSAKDIPGKNSFYPSNMFGYVSAEEIFCSGKVLFNGQPVGIILANTFNLANYAASLVKITYKSSNERIFTSLKEVLDQNIKERIVEEPYTINVKEFGTNRKHTFSGEMELGSQFHYTMEPQTCVCIPNETGLQIYAATQWMDVTQIVVSEALKLNESKINIEVKRLGGGFGAKISRAAQIVCACALACQLTNRAVRLVLPIETNMEAIGKRCACINKYNVEVDEKGIIQKLESNYYEDYGSCLNEPVTLVTTQFLPNCYDTKSWNIKPFAVLTDTPSNTWMRGPGPLEGIALTEQIMEHIAHETKLNSIDVRLANMSTDNPMKQIYPNFVDSTNYVNRRKEIETFNQENRWIKQGISVLPMDYPQGYMGSHQTLVSIYHTDGTVVICPGGIEMGQGLNTKLVQTAAHILDIPMEAINVRAVNNAVSPNGVTSGGSQTSEGTAYAVMKACEILLERIKPVRDEMKDASWQEITHACYLKDIQLSAVYSFNANELKPYKAYGACCTEVEIDLLTGNMNLKRVDILEDTGESMSPLMDIGQIEGAFIMGIGYWLTESLVYDIKGKLVTNRTWNYKPPGAKDIPIDFRISFLQNSSNPCGVLRSKTTGEPALTLAVTAIFALRHALNSARKDAGLKDEFYPLGAPATADILFMKSGNTIEQYKLN